MDYTYFYPTKIGEIVIRENGSGITHISTKACFVMDDSEVSETPLLKKAAQQIQEYLEGKRTAFDLPLSPEGTPFQKAAWEALLTIPYGETRSYKQMAEQVGNPKACRAIGMANNRNPIMIVVPCHRVIGADGKLVGYGGGLDMKRKLLEIEKGKL